MKCKCILLLTLLFVIPAMAQYRVFQYSVRTTLPKPFDQNSYTVISTLDPVSYLAYHGGRNSLELNILRTWTCPGYTGGLEICDSPEEKIIDQLGDIR